MITDELKQRAQELADAAMPLDGPMRDDFLKELESVSPALRGEVEALLAHRETMDVAEFPADATIDPGSSNPDDIITLDAVTPAAGAEDDTQQFGASIGTDSGPETIGASTSNSASVTFGDFGPKFGADYEIVGTIGRGGMGTVFKAYQLSLRRHVALKTISQQNLRSPSDVARFQVEAEATAKLDHPGIVPVYDVGEWEGSHYYSMAYIEGQSLSDLLKRGKQRIKPRKAAELMEKVCRAVQYAHDRAVIHRDLKPSNIMLDKEGNPRLTDFGLAKLQKSDDNLTMTGQVLGTPSFMAPEQAAGKLEDISNRTDVYSLGATLYALLSGRPPFRGETVVDTLRQVVSTEPASLKSAGKDIHGDLQVICSKCMAKLPADRYASAGDAADDLQRFLDGFPIAARPLGPIARAQRWSRRNPAIAASLAAVVFALVTGSIVALAYGIEAQRQKRIAVDARDRAIIHANQLEAAIEDFFVVVSKDMLMNQPGMQPLRERLLQRATAHYKEAASQALEGTISSARPAQALIMLGRIEAADERFEESGKSFRQAQVILEKLLKIEPDSIENILSLARTHNELATVASQQFSRITKLVPFAHLSGSEATAAESVLDKWKDHASETVRIRKQLVELEPNDPEPIRLLANAFMNQGSAIDALIVAGENVSQANEARELMLKGQSLRDNARQKYPGETLFIRDLGIGFQELGRHEAHIASYESNDRDRTNHLSQAVEDMTRAIEQFEEYLGETKEIDVQHRLANCYRQRADIYFSNNQLDLADADYFQAIQIANDLSESNPRVYTYRVSLAEIEFNRCQLLFVRNEAPEAFVQLDDCQKTLVAALRIYPDIGETGSNQAAEDYVHFVTAIAQQLANINLFDIAVQRIQIACDQLQSLIEESPEYGGLSQFIEQMRKTELEIEQQAEEESRSA